MPIAPGATARPKILLSRNRPKAPNTPPAPRNLSPRIQSQPRHVTMRRSRLRKRTRRIRRRSSETVSKNKTNKPRQLMTTPRPQRRRRRGVTQVRSRISTVIRKAIMPATVPSLQKTSIGLGNLRAGDQ